MEYTDYVKITQNCSHLRITPFRFQDVSGVAWNCRTELIEKELKETGSYNPLLYTKEKEEEELHFHLILTTKCKQKLIKFIKKMGAVGNKAYATSNIRDAKKMIKYVLKTPYWFASGFSEDCVNMFKAFNRISYKSVKDIQPFVYDLEDDLMLLKITFEEFCGQYVDLCVQYNAQTRISQLRRYFKFIKIRHRYVKYEKHGVFPNIQTIHCGIEGAEQYVEVGDYEEIKKCYIADALDFYSAPPVKCLGY